MGQPVVHFEVQGNDREALARFYAQLFGWKTSDVSEMNYTMVETGGDATAVSVRRRTVLQAA